MRADAPAARRLLYSGMTTDVEDAFELGCRAHRAGEERSTNPFAGDGAMAHAMAHAAWLMGWMQTRSRQDIVESRAATAHAAGERYLLGRAVQASHNAREVRLALRRGSAIVGTGTRGKR